MYLLALLSLYSILSTQFSFGLRGGLNSPNVLAGNSTNFQVKLDFFR
ncbi:MAG: hypothetical protein ACK5L7_10305 [Paludibacteraceae bacterium]